MITTKLAEIQKTLKAPKGQFNAFGKYKYRSCEDILEAVKPILGELALIVSDEVVSIGSRFYIKAKATLTDGKETISSEAFAREPEIRKGMDESQITGASSSYARKYALNGLFCIDDAKDADSQDNSGGGFIDEKQQATIEEYLISTESDEARFLKFLGVPSLDKILVKDYSKAIDALKTKVKK